MNNNNNTLRLLNCARCHRQILLCSGCDRGHRYCNVCKSKAQREARRATAERYQNSSKGRLNHARRMHRYRERQKEKVTHHSSKPIPSHDSLKMPQRTQLWRIEYERLACCHRCGAEGVGLYRLDFLNSSRRILTSKEFDP